VGDDGMMTVKSLKEMSAPKGKMMKKGA